MYSSNSSGGANIIKWEDVMTNGIEYIYKQEDSKKYKFEIQASMASWGRRVYPYWFFDKEVDNDFKRVKDFPKNSLLNPYLKKTTDDSSFMERINRIPFGKDGYIEILKKDEELSYIEVPGLGIKTYSQKKEEYEKIPYNDYKKHFSYLLNGLLLTDSIEYTNDKKMKEVLLSNFFKIYHDGQILYFLKLIVRFLDGYIKLEKGNQQQKSNADSVLNSEDSDIFQKISNINKYSWSNENIKDYLEQNYYLVTNNNILKLFESVDSFEKFESVFDEYVFNDLLLEDLAINIIPKFIETNKRILNRFEYYLQNKESLVKTIMKDINDNQLFNQIVYSSYYPTSLGTYFINSLKSLIS